MTSLAVTTQSQSEFERLLQRSQRRAYNLAYRLTGNVTEAEDVVQDAAVRAWSHFETFDTNRSFEGWLFRIITNRVIDMRRRQRIAQIYSLDAPAFANDEDASSVEFADPGSDPATIVLGPIMDERLQTALNALPSSYRTAILLSDVEQRTYEEVANLLHCPIGTVRSRLYRARVMLRKQLGLGRLSR